MKAKVLDRRLTLLLLVLLARMPFNAHAQSGTWTWIGSGVNDSGYYGIQGVPSAKNYPPARTYAAYWTSLDGTFWLFGGISKYGTLSDLWKYNTFTNEWTWVKGPKFGLVHGTPGHYGIKGVPSPTNLPPSIGMASFWADVQGNLWLFGGLGIDSTGDTLTATQYLNDLWRYDININEWTWVKGSGLKNSPGIYGTPLVPNPANTPPGLRWAESTWTDDDNNLWLFGGDPNGGGATSDLWRYNIITNQWTYMINKAKSFGFGTKGIEDSTSLPFPGTEGMHWKDVEGNFYYTHGGGGGNFSIPVWRYNPKTNNWTWIADSFNVSAVSGRAIHKCNPNEGDFPLAANNGCQCPQINGCTDVFWLFSGGNGNLSNDLWAFNSKTLQWAWISGSDPYITDTGYFGIKGVPSTANRVPGRIGAALWMDKQNNFWVFSGNLDGYTGSCTFCPHNDLWRYIPDTSCFHWNPGVSIVHTKDTSVCPGHSFVYNATHMPHVHVEPMTDVLKQDSTIFIFTPHTPTTYTFYYDNTGCNGVEGLRFTIKILNGPFAAFDFSPAKATVMQNAVLLKNTSNLPGTFKWLYKSNVYSHAMADTVLVLPPAVGTYCVSLVAGSDSNACIDTLTKCVQVIDTALLFVPTAFSPNGDGVNDVLYAIVPSANVKLKTFKIYNRWGQQVFETQSLDKGWDGTFNGKPEDVGTYVYYVEAESTTNGKSLFAKGTVTLVR